MTETNQPAPPGKFLIDPYEEWAKREGVPIHVGGAVDMLKAEVKPWARFGVHGAIPGVFLRIQTPSQYQPSRCAVSPPSPNGCSALAW